MNIIHHKKSISQALFTFVIAGLFIIPGSASVFTELQKNSEQTAGRGSTVYVDDSNIEGPWDGTLDYPYRYIQDGVDHSTDGDTVFVFTGFYQENVVVGKSITLVAEDKETYITSYGFGTVIKILAEHVIITGFTIAHCGDNSNNAGIMIHTSNNTITDNDIQYNENYGIYVLAVNNEIYHNNFIQNAFQAYDSVEGNQWDGGYPTGGNYWSDYNGIDANEDGIGDVPYPTGYNTTDRYPLIHPYGSITNRNNSEVFLSIQAAIDDDDTLNGHTIFAMEGMYWEHLLISKSLTLQGYNYHKSIIDGGLIGDVITINADKVSLLGFKIQHSGQGELNAGIIVNGNNCLIDQNIIYDNFHGIILKQATENAQITGNTISDNGWNGIILNPGCSGTLITGNTIADNFYAGLGISQASNNYIYHNNFKANRHQAYDNAANIWDDGYPSGGNYWSDYTGSDSDGDGIGDIPYAIPDGINTDQYPLMTPYTGGDTTPPIVKIQTPSNGLYLWGLRLFSGLFRKSSIIYGPITIQVEAVDAQSGIKQVEFLIDDSVTPASVDYQAPYSWEWSTLSLLMHKHTIIVIAYDNAGNPNYDMLEVRKYL
jgi:parallel beta-helix repeat protein